MVEGEENATENQIGDNYFQKKILHCTFGIIQFLFYQRKKTKNKKKKTNNFPD